MIDSIGCYAFLDESGTVGASKGTHFLVVAVLAAENPRDLELPVRRALKKQERGLIKSELKAAHNSEKANFRLLEAIAKHDVGIVAVIVDQQAILRPPEDPEEIYRQAAARAVRLLVEHCPKVEICLDKRYTHKPLRYELERRIREDLVDIFPQMVLLRQESSQERKELQAVDVVAWAFFQKYERGNPRFYEVIAPRVLAEEVIARENWQE
jgi:hypothetical protein